MTLWGGIGVVRVLQDAINTIWGVPRFRRPGFFPKLGRGMLIIGLLGLGVVGTAVVAGVTLAVDLPILAAIAAALGNVAISTGIAIVLYRIVIATSVRTADILPGAYDPRGPVALSDDGSLLVNARLPQVREPDRSGRLAEDHGGERNAVDPYVEQGSSAEPLVEEPGSGVEIRPEAEVQVQHPHLAYGSFGDKPPHLFHQREEPGPHALHDEEPSLPGELDHPFGFDGVHGEWFLAEHGLPGLEAQRGVLRVEGVGCSDVDDVYVGV